MVLPAHRANLPGGGTQCRPGHLDVCIFTGHCTGAGLADRGQRTDNRGQRTDDRGEKEENSAKNLCNHKDKRRLLENKNTETFWI